MEKRHSDKINLEDLQKKVLFDVPENYFEELPQRIQKKVLYTEKLPLHKWIVLNPVFRYSSLVVVALLLIVSGYFYQSNKTTEKNSFSLSSMSGDEIYSYIEDNYYFHDPELVHLVEIEYTAHGKKFEVPIEDELLQQYDAYEIQELVSEL